MALTTVGVPQVTTSLVGDVPKKREDDAELVRMSLPRPGTSQGTMTEQRKDGKTITKSR